MAGVRMKLYRQDETRAMLSEVSSLGDVKIEPKVSTKVAYTPKDSHVGKLDFEEATTLMDRLSEGMILRRRFHDKFIRCPHCNSFSVRIRIICTKCGSHNIYKGQALEHLRCGYAGLEEGFKKGDEFICPKCRRELTQIGVDYKRAGTWFKCRGCGEFFGEPTIRFYCEECQDLFRLYDAIFKDVYTYEFNEEIRAELQENTSFLDLIFARLRKSGFEVHRGGDITGHSGIAISFDLLAEKNKKLIAIEFLNNEASLDNILAIYAKSLEVDIDRIVVVATVGIKKEAGLLAENYGITLIEGRDPTALDKNLRKVLSKYK